MKDTTPPQPPRYDRMIYRRCGRTGLKLPVLSLGAAFGTLAGQVDFSATREIVGIAFDRGVTHFDLANNYGHPPGNAERVFGRILPDFPREEMVIASKAGFHGGPGPYGIGLSRKSLIDSCERSLRRLRLDYLDLFYAHAPDAETPLEETLSALDLLVRQGKILYAGIANQDAAGLGAIAAIQRAHALTPLAVHQTPYNILARGAESAILPASSETGLGVVAFSVLGQGVLSGKYLDGPAPERSRVARLWTDEDRAVCLNERVLGQIRALQTLAEARGQTLAQFCIAWTVANPRITSIVFGVTSKAQLLENLGALDAPDFSEDEQRRIDAITPPPS